VPSRVVQTDIVLNQLNSNKATWQSCFGLLLGVQFGACSRNSGGQTHRLGPSTTGPEFPEKLLVAHQLFMASSLGGA